MSTMQRLTGQIISLSLFCVNIVMAWPGLTWAGISPMDMITRALSTANFLCIRSFLAWWQTNTRTTNWLILEQSCSWPLKRQTYAISINSGGQQYDAKSSRQKDEVDEVWCCVQTKRSHLWSNKMTSNTDAVCTGRRQSRAIRCLPEHWPALCRRCLLHSPPPPACARLGLPIAVTAIEVASVINLSAASGQVAAGLFIKFTLQPLVL